MGTGTEDTRRQHKRKDPTHARVFANAIAVATKARGLEREREDAGICERGRR
jgi:hypothetical protein